MNTPKNSKKNIKQERSRKKIKSRAQEIAMDAAMQMRGGSHSLGSYTGTARDGDKPEQDADDL